MILAVALAFVPRRDDIVGLAALSGALLVAFQLATTYWFYLYLVWVAPLALIAFLARLRRAAGQPGAGAGSSTCSIESARSRCEQRMTTPLSHGSSSEVSKRTCICVTSDSIASSFLTPITPPRGPVMPTSVM